MNDQGSVVAVYSSHKEAEQAVAKLSEASFDITKVSIIGRITTARRRWSATTVPVIG